MLATDSRRVSTVLTQSDQDSLQEQTDAFMRRLGIVAEHGTSSSSPSWAEADEICDVPDSPSDHTLAALASTDTVPMRAAPETRLQCEVLREISKHHVVADIDQHGRDERKRTTTRLLAIAASVMVFGGLILLLLQNDTDRPSTVSQVVTPDSAIEQLPIEPTRQIESELQSQPEPVFDTSIAVTPPDAVIPPRNVLVAVPAADPPTEITPPAVKESATVVTSEVSPPRAESVTEDDSDLVPHANDSDKRSAIDVVRYADVYGRPYYTSTPVE